MIVDPGVLVASERGRARVKVLETLPVEPYDLATAEVHGRLLADVHRNGTKRGAHGLIIAATAIVTKRTILMTDLNARFQDLPGVDCIEVA